MNLPKVAVVILNWNGFADTEECLESFKRLDYPDYRIVLVDNGSQNNDGKKLKELFPAIHLIENRENRGFAGGNNDGMNWALDQGFDYIVNLNNDCIVEKNWLANLINGLLTAKADFGSSMILFYDERALICSDNDVLLPDGSAIPINRNKPVPSDDKPREIFAACGAGSIYSRACLEKIKIKGSQFFDELHFAFYEDVDLGMRLNAKSCRGVVVPTAIVYHKHSRTAGRFSEFKMFHSEKNRILNEILNYPFWLIIVGEFFFCWKLGAGFIYSLLNRKSKGARYREKVSAADFLLLLLKARGWILKNLKNILADRRERKRLHLIKSDIYKYFYWNVFDFLK